MILIPDAEIDRWLADDVPLGDLTTRALDIGAQPGQIHFAARAAMVAAGGEEAARLLTRTGCTVSFAAPSGHQAQPGEILLRAHGPAAALLAGWKVAQTLMEHVSGIATATHALVAAARAVNPAIAIACTRKVFPGTKALALKAIMAGGAVPHRLGLSETILLFPEHRAFAGALPDAVARLRLTCPERKIVVEVTSLDEARQAAAAGAHVVQLEKFTPDETAQAVALLRDSAALVAAAGGVTTANAADYARAGAHILVSSAPYAAPPADVKVAITPA